MATVQGEPNYWFYGGSGTWSQPAHVDPWSGWHLSASWFNVVYYSWDWRADPGIRQFTNYAWWNSWTASTFGGWNFWWSPSVGGWAFHQWWANVWIVEYLNYYWGVRTWWGWADSGSQWFWSVNYHLYWFSASWDYYSYQTSGGWTWAFTSWSDWGRSFWSSDWPW